MQNQALNNIREDEDSLEAKELDLKLETVEHSYTDIDGEPMFSIKAELEPAPFATPERRVMRLRRLTIIDPNTLKQCELAEVLPMAYGSSSNTPVFIVPPVEEGSYEVGASGMYKDEQIAMYIPLFDPAFIGVLFHEFGHAVQSKDPRMKDLYSLYIQSQDPFAHSPNAPSGTFIESIIKNTIDSSEILKLNQQYAPYMKAIREIEGIYEDSIQIDSEIGALKNLRYSVDFSGEMGTVYLAGIAHDINEKRKEEDVIHSKLFEKQMELFEIGKKCGIEKVSNWPHRIMERNANTQAFRTIRILKHRFGINIGGEYVNRRHGTEEATTITGFLKNGVYNGWHGAVRAQLAHEDTLTGKIRMPRITKDILES
ncbi:MAG: hypothetical protein HZA95_00540 [Candidatus Vogelbacteria bacterium]|nr:hypothetical protein [Candidatus Vogelbacteria bacterium]